MGNEKREREREFMNSVSIVTLSGECRSSGNHPDETKGERVRYWHPNVRENEIVVNQREREREREREKRGEPGGNSRNCSNDHYRKSGRHWHVGHSVAFVALMSLRTIFLLVCVCVFFLPWRWGWGRRSFAGNDDHEDG